MMTLLARLFIRDAQNTASPRIKTAYAALSSLTGIVLNLLLCVAKLVTGFFSGSVAVSADGLNNLSDAGTSLLSLLGFRIARYGSGSAHPFGHGRIEWIMAIFASLAVLWMGAALAGTSARAILHPQPPAFSVPMLLVLALSVLVKLYMYVYNRRFARLTGSEALKAAAADCLSDSASTAAVLLSSLLSHFAGWTADGWCGLLVSACILFTGGKSLWEVLGRIMGQAPDPAFLDALRQTARAYPVITGVYDLMVHDYGFGYFVVTLRAEGRREDSDALRLAASQISYDLYRRFGCDCFIQTACYVEDEALVHSLARQAALFLADYSPALRAENLRLLDGGPFLLAAFDLIYPAGMQDQEDTVRQALARELEAAHPGCRTIIHSVVQRQRVHLPLHPGEKQAS